MIMLMNQVVGVNPWSTGSPSLIPKNTAEKKHKNLLKTIILIFKELSSHSSDH